MAITRQMKRKMLRDLNNPEKVNQMMKRQEHKNEVEMTAIKNSKKRKLAVIAISALVLGMVTLFLLS